MLCFVLFLHYLLPHNFYLHTLPHNIPLSVGFCVLYRLEIRGSGRKDKTQRPPARPYNVVTTVEMCRGYRLLPPWPLCDCA